MPKVLPGHSKEPRSKHVSDRRCTLLTAPLIHCIHFDHVARFSDFTMTDSGLQYKDYKEGTGELPQDGDTAVVDWGGYTIGEVDAGHPISSI